MLWDVQGQGLDGGRGQDPLEGPDWEVWEPRASSEVRLGGACTEQNAARVQNVASRGWLVTEERVAGRGGQGDRGGAKEPKKQVGDTLA